jgi:hypothetical protein
MSPASRLRRWQGAVMVPLALWSIVPGIRWCPLGWDEVRAECFTACSARDLVMEAGSEGCCERACAPGASPLLRGDPDAGEGRAAQLPLCGDPDAGESCSAPANEYPGGRAFCLGGPSGGDAVPPIAPHAPDLTALAATLPGAAVAMALPERAACPVAVTAMRPPPAPTGAVPRGRAPPGTDGITC